MVFNTMSLFEENEIEEYDSERDDKTRLFETQQRNVRSWHHYFKLLLIVALFVLVVGSVVFYFSLPSVGDAVKSPEGLEDAVRTHFLDVEKRTMTDAAAFYCDKFYWIKVDVETRPDIVGKPNSTVSKYVANATQQPDGTWTVTATPVAGEDWGDPCS
ncbi:MAG: hypothetical protein ABJB40_04180 [Acidobacteriota bacterium]